MPGPKPFLIANEYLQPGEPQQVRKNAVTALAALDDHESREILAHNAVTESDPEVRQRMQSEIVKMPREASQKVLALVLRELEVPEKQGTAYTLLGELRNKGLSFTFPPLPFSTRLRLAKTMRDYLYPNRSFRFHFRAVKGSLLGTLLAWLALLAFCLSLQSTPDPGIVLVAGCLLAAVVSAAGTLLASPAGLYADSKGGALLDTLVAGLATLGAAAVVTLVSFALKSPSPYLWVVTAPLVGAAVKAGTLGAFGLAKGEWLNRIIQIVAGGSCGLAIYEFVLIVTGHTGDEFLAGSWMWIVLVSYGLAGAFASIDSRSERRPVVSPFATTTVLLVTVLFVVFNLVQLIPFRTPETQNWGALRAPYSKTFDVRHLSETYSFTVDAPSKIEAKPADHQSPQQPFVATLIGPRVQTELLYSSEKLDPGVPYKISITRKKRKQEITDGLTEMVKQMSWYYFRARVRRSTPVKEPPVTIEVNIEPATGAQVR